MLRKYNISKQIPHGFAPVFVRDKERSNIIGMQYQKDNVRNICLLGHGGVGKTTLAESLMYFTGAIDRMGSTAEGNTVCDFDPEEIKRGISISTAVTYVEWNGCKVNILDTPGYFDFEGEAMQGVSAADTAVVLVSAKDGIHYGTTKAIKLAEQFGLPMLFFITKVDEEHSDFHTVYEKLRARYGEKICAISVPMMKNGAMEGYIDIIEMQGKRIENGKAVPIPIPEEFMPLANRLHDALNEAVAGTSEERMEKFFEGEEFSIDEIKDALNHGIFTRSIFPVLCGSAVTMAGLGIFLNYITRYTGCPAVDQDAAAAVRVFKTTVDPFVGKLSFFKVVRGSLKSGDSLVNIRTGGEEKFAHIYTVRGRKQTETDALCGGDIGVVAKLQSVATGDVLSAGGAACETVELRYPRPCLSKAVYPVKKGDEEKIAQGMQRLSEEDKTFSFYTDGETHEQILSGMGETHLDVIVSKLKSKFGVDVVLKEPKVAYREAIRKKVKVQGKHKKQSGGHGQYGDVWIEFEPYDGQELLFEEKIFGGSVPKNFHPAVEKGLRESAEHGVLAGYPVVGLKATLVDGSYHDVDSSEMSFKIAAGIAYREGLKQADPVILEPIGRLVVTVPDSMMGDIIGDITRRRGQILGMTPTAETLQSIEADVPMAEMGSYATDLRSMTRGRGTFTFDFSRYADAPSAVAQKVIEAAQTSE